MSDPTMHNRLSAAGRAAADANRSRTPEDDPVVQEYTAGIHRGDQLAHDIKSVWIDAYDDALDTPRPLLVWNRGAGPR